MTPTRPPALSHQQAERIRSAWDGVAEGFDEFVTPQAMPLAEDALSRVGLVPGMRFLDIATGSGALAIPAARLGARVLATDISPVMIEQLRSRARAEGLLELEARIMDGQNLDLDDDHFDVAASQNGVSVFPDMSRGLREMVRVTKPGGRVLVVAFGRLERAEFLGLFIAALKASLPDFPGLPTNPPPLPFQVAAVDQLHAVMASAGLADVHVDTSTWRMEIRSARHLWDTVTSSNPIGAALVADLTDEQIADILHTLDGMLLERSGGEPATVLTSAINIGIGVKVRNR